MNSAEFPLISIVVHVTAGPFSCEETCTAYFEDDTLVLCEMVLPHKIKHQIPLLLAGIEQMDSEPDTRKMRLQVPGGQTYEISSKDVASWDDFHGYCKRYACQLNYERKYLFVYTISQKKKVEFRLLQSRDTHQFYIGKVIPRSSIEDSKARRACLHNEIRALNQFGGLPGVVRLAEIYQSGIFYILIMENMAGGPLLSCLSRRKQPFSEEQTSKMIKQLVEVLDLLHSGDFIHRNITLDSIFLTSESDLTLNVGEFQFSGDSTSIDRRRQNGMPGYMAPELFSKKSGYSPKSDIFAAGMVLATLLLGSFPLKAESSHELHSKNKHFELILKVLQQQRDISDEALDLLAGMLERDKHRRFSTKEILNHPFILRQRTPSTNDHGLGDDLKEAISSTPPKGDSHRTFREKLQYSNNNTPIQSRKHLKLDMQNMEEFTHIEQVSKKQIAYADDNESRASDISSLDSIELDPFYKSGLDILTMPQSAMLGVGGLKGRDWAKMNSSQPMKKDEWNIMNNEDEVDDEDLPSQKVQKVACMQFRLIPQCSTQQYMRTDHI